MDFLGEIKKLDWYDKIKPDEVVFDEQQCDRSNELYTTIISMPKFVKYFSSRQKVEQVTYVGDGIWSVSKDE